MNFKDFVFIRHGNKKNDDSNFHDIELTKKGYEQARLSGRRLSSFNIKSLYTSDMIRAIQTAETINLDLSLDIITEPALREIDMGVFNCGWNANSGKYSDFVSEFEKHESDMAYPDGESGSDVWARTRAFVERTAQEKGNALIVTHGGTIRCMICGMLGLPFFKRFLLGEPIHNCGISVIRCNIDSGTFSLQLFNDNSHLLYA